MPTIASKSTSATVRRVRRRERHIQTRSRNLVVLPYNSPPAIRRRLHRRQNRDQSVFDLENCFNVCQDQGFHQDPDVHIGSEASKVNHHGVLDPEASAPSLPRPPQSEFPFIFPPPSAANTVAPGLFNADIAGSDLPETSQGQSSSKKCIWPSQSKSGATQPTSTPPLPSIPTTPPPRARVKLPCTYPASGRQTPRSIGQTPAKDFFDGIKIPSPLLYHRRSREQLLTRSSDVDISTELTKAFLLTCGRDLPEPDFESYKVFDEIPIRKDPLSPSRPVEPGGQTPVDSILQKRRDLAFQNIPHPPWIMQLYRPDLQRLFKTPPVPLPEPPLTIPPRPPPTPPILTTTNTFSISQLGIPCRDSPAPLHLPDFKYHLSKNASDYDLIFPKLPTPPSCVVAGAQQLSSSGKEMVKFIEDDLTEVSRRWQAFEDAILDPKRRISLSEDTVIAQSAVQPFPWSLQKAETQPWVDFAACPSTNCMALVPARLYQHQYLAWPQIPANFCNFKEVTYPILQSAALEDVEAEKVAKMAEWINDLGFEAKHTEGCTAATGSGISSGFGLEQMFAAGSEPHRRTCMEPEFDTAEPPQLSTPDSEVLISEVSDLLSTDSESMDEGNFTGESTVDVGQDDAAMSEDEWAHWDWNNAPQSQNVAFNG